MCALCELVLVLAALVLVALVLEGPVQALMLVMLLLLIELDSAASVRPFRRLSRGSSLSRA